MRIHTDHLTTYDIHNAALVANVGILDFSVQGSRSRGISMDVWLSGSHYAAGQHDHETPAATWDEWGVFLAELFKIDPDAKCGHYDGRDDFIAKTTDEYNRFVRWQQNSTHNRALIKTAPWLAHN